jgi:hypothetical protein
MVYFGCTCTAAVQDSGYFTWVGCFVHTVEAIDLSFMLLVIIPWKGVSCVVLLTKFRILLLSPQLQGSTSNNRLDDLAT